MEAALTSDTERLPGFPPRFVQPPLPADLRGLPTRPNASQPFELNCRALPISNPAFDFSTVDMYCTESTLDALRKLTANHRNQIGIVRYHLYLVHDTLVVKRWNMATEDLAKGPKSRFQELQKFKAACTTQEGGLPADSRYFQTVQYRLGDLSCVVSGQRDAYIAGSDSSIETSLGHSDEEGLCQTNLGVGVVASGKIISPDQLVVVGELAERAPGKQHKNARDRKRKVCAKAWFSGVNTLIWGRLSSDSGRWIDVSHQKVRGTASASVQKHAQQLASLISELKEAVRLSKNGVAVMTANRYEGPDLEVWEPVFDANALEAIPEHLHVPRSCFPEDFVERFWVENRSEKQAQQPELPVPV
jgi:hypothetical protein